MTVTDERSRPTTCQQKILQRAQRRAKASKLFDSDTYLALHPDVMDAQLDALEHFLSYGFQEEGAPPSLMLARACWAN